MQTNAGFSLLELVIIIGIIGILAVMPMLNWPGTALTLDAQAKQVAHDIRYTQSLSLSKRERYRIVRTAATSYQILNSTGTPIVFADGNNSVTLNTGLSFGTWTNLPNNLIAFDTKGAPYLDATTPGTALAVGTTYSIAITDGSDTKTVSITPLTGRVQVS